jgi:WD40 repeat protein
VLRRVVHKEKELTEVLFDGSDHVVATSIAGRVVAMTLAGKQPLSLELGAGTPKIGVEHGLLAVARGRRAELYDLDSGLRLGSRSAHEEDAHAVALHAGRLVSTGWDRRVRIDPVGAARGLRALPLSSNHEVVAFSKDALRVALFGQLEGDAGPSGLIVTDLDGSGARRVPMTGFGMGVVGDAKLERVVALTNSEVVFVSPDGVRGADIGGRALAASDDLSRVYVSDNSGELWSFDGEGDGVRIVEELDDVVSALATTTDGRLVAALADGVRVFESPGYEEVWSFAAPRFNTRFAFSPDGAYFAIAMQGSVSVFETESFGVAWHLDVPDLSPSTVRFDDGGQRLAIGTSSNGPDSLRVLDLRDGTVGTYDSPAGTIDVLFSRDGRRVVTSSSDGAVTLWQDGVAVPLRIRPFAASMRLAFGPDEQTLVGISAQARAFTLDVPLVSRERLTPVGNLRVCRDGLEVVVASTPTESPWGADSDCAR